MTLNITDFAAVFMSYDECYADEFYVSWKKIFKDIKRVRGIHGLNNAHIQACETASDDYFVLIDADTLPHEHNIMQFSTNTDIEAVVTNFTAVQFVTNEVTPHGALKIIDKKRGPDFFRGAASTVGDYVLSRGFVVADSLPLSIEFTNQTPDMAFRAAYKDVELLLRQYPITYPVTHIEKQDLSQLRGKRRRILSWLINGADVPNGLYSIYGAHTAVFDVFTKQVTITSSGMIDFYKDFVPSVTHIRTFDELLERLKHMYAVLGITPVMPRHPSISPTSFDTMISVLLATGD